MMIYVRVQWQQSDAACAPLQVLQQEMSRLARSEELGKLDAASKACADREAWTGWLRRYRARLQQEADAGADPQRRITTMNGINPRSAPAARQSLLLVAEEKFRHSLFARLATWHYSAQLVCPCAVLSSFLPFS